VKNNVCKKKRFDEIGAKWAVAQAIHSQDKRRKEVRYYWCSQCNSYHLTSDKIK
jgi:hypothetical protein